VPIFIVKKEVFEWVRTGQKTIELRRGRAREGDKAVFQCGRDILNGLYGIVEGRFTTFLKPSYSLFESY
jgi:ASC-1-like (ASCH) protein